MDAYTAEKFEFRWIDGDGSRMKEDTSSVTGTTMCVCSVKFSFLPFQRLTHYY
jgi:hypothetical protein